MTKREFRSDTMTLPTAEMRSAMRDAEVGDDVCGEDPTINLLEKLAADLTGMDNSLFVPSGTFGNQCAIGVHTRQGDEILLGETVHVIDHEAGAPAALWGVQTRTIRPQISSYPTAEEFASRIRPSGDLHQPETGLILLENALSDGSVMPLSEMEKVAELAKQKSIPIHLDGARVFNAAIALETSVSNITAHTDSVMFCLSKGLGAPVGSMLCGSHTFIQKARRRRKMMGGAMRQAGILAAAGIIALRDGVSRLAEDHENAHLLAHRLANIPGIEIDTSKVRTNIVFCSVNQKGRTNEELVRHIYEKGFETYPPEWWGVRFVTSSRVSMDDVEDLASAIKNYMSEN